MTRVSSSEHILLLLRERLQRMDRGRKGARSAPGGRGDAAQGSPLNRLQALAALDQIDPDELRRTLVRALLSEELGEAVANDPSFEAVAEEVFRLISDSEDGRVLIERAEEELRSKG
jgi:hypothetical protein